MRIRKRKHTDERIERCGELLCALPEENKGKWQEFFGNSNPIHLEIGCGKGDFMVELARRNPDINYIALEKEKDVIVIALEKAQAAGITNVTYCNSYAENLTDFFEKNEIQRVYLNFSDPWKKSRHAKRRLTSEKFLISYREILPDDGSIFFKTDNRPLFDFSLEQFPLCGFRLENVTFDLHNSEFAADNIMTEYERNFSAKGFPINRLEAYIIPGWVQPEGEKEENEETDNIPG
ncbi:MAG: tRNA (guanosine(46)-N7)-methyltransferase TrmB [Clostridia bacterium]|nr:tRNA (guanosine(46)-N7)-methyltransferase TrmB [Clostridia bacterium]